MAKRSKGKQKTRLTSSAGTGHFYTAPTFSLVGKEIMKFDPVQRKRVLYKGQKMK